MFELNMTCCLIISKGLHPVKVHGDWHHGEGDRHDDGEPYPDPVDQLEVSAVVYTQRAEGALEAVHEVVGQREAADQVEDHEPYIGEGLLHQAKEIVYGYTGG